MQVSVLHVFHNDEMVVSTADGLEAYNVVILEFRHELYLLIKALSQRTLRITPQLLNGHFDGDTPIVIERSEIEITMAKMDSLSQSHFTKLTDPD